MPSVDKVAEEVRHACACLSTDDLAEMDERLRSARALLTDTCNGTNSPVAVAMLAWVAEASQHLGRSLGALQAGGQALDAYLTEIGAERGTVHPLPAAADHPLPAGDDKANRVPHVPERAVDIAAGLVVVGWPQVVADQAMALLGDRGRDELFSGTANCHGLATIAHQLADNNELLHDLLGRAAEEIVLRCGIPAPAAQVVAALVKRIKIPSDPVLTNLVRLLRVTGVAVCASQQALDSCACLSDLAADVVAASLAEILRSGLRPDDLNPPSS